MVGRNIRRGDDHFGAKGLQEVYLLAAHLVGNGEDDLVASDKGGEGESRPRVSRCRLDDDAARLDDTASLGIANHRESYAVFHTATRVEVFELCVDCRRETSCDPVELHEGSPPNGLEDATNDSSVHRRGCVVLAANKLVGKSWGNPLSPRQQQPRHSYRSVQGWRGTSPGPPVSL